MTPVFTIIRTCVGAATGAQPSITPPTNFWERQNRKRKLPNIITENNFLKYIFVS
jgi:hypothetical protein